MHPWITEALAREHVTDLRGRPGSAMTVAKRRRRRTGDALGRWLIHLGQRMVVGDGSAIRLPGEAARARGTPASTWPNPAYPCGPSGLSVDTKTYRGTNNSSILEQHLAWEQRRK